MKTLDEAVAAVEASNIKYREAVEENATASLLALALTAKDLHQDIEYVGYDWSDQPGSDSLTTMGVYNEMGGEVEVDENDADNALWEFISNLGEMNRSIWGPFVKQSSDIFEPGVRSAEVFDVQAILDSQP